jgi:hypothetical protein
MYNNYLIHHGIKGQRWGIRRYQNADGSLTLAGKKRYTKTSHYNDWGKDADHNILYITGYSGSGKSTKAKQIAKSDNAEIIHLDLYTERVGSDLFKKDSNKRFNAYLRKNGYDRNEYLKLAYSKDPNVRKQRWKLLDDLGDLITNYGKELYGNKKLIVEGVQLSDQTIYPNKDFFIDKPVMFMKTSAIKSWYRASIRDQKFTNINPQDIKKVKRYVDNYIYMYKNKKLLETKIHAQ